MVLKETNNIDLVENWINSITDIYDLQNKGEKEADNLGELLYILSTSSNPNTELIERIEAEAEEIATNNPNGYYLYGRTDYGEQFLYQNLWYILVIESVGRTYHFDLNSIPEDAYSKMAWWSDYEIKDKTNTFNDDLYPYLTIGSRHKLGTGTIPLNENLYPLSWEVAATEAKYDNYIGIDNHMCFAKTSPLHSWTASEFILLLLDDTGDLQ